jgi:hypothetical protein
MLSLLAWFYDLNLFAGVPPLVFILLIGWIKLSILWMVSMA